MSTKVKGDPVQLLTALGQRFGATPQPERHYAGLQGRRHWKGEPLADLADDIQRLVGQVYPTIGEEAQAQLARLEFIRAIDNADL